jgi:UDP-N-acetylmuramoyl-tripeptide--D-alanyl-D-alanine ligase
MLTVGHFLEALAPSEPYQTTGAEPVVLSVVIDSREADLGSLFVAFVGEQVDGHDYVDAAFERGAVAAIVERPLPNHVNIDLRQGGAIHYSGRLPVCLVVDSSIIALQMAAKAWRKRLRSIESIGITGSVGKTSTKELIYAVLSRRFRTLKSPGNYNNEIGLPLTLLQLNRSHQRAILEMGMYQRGEIALLCDLAKPTIGVVTNVSAVHLERLGSLEAIVEAKRELVENLPANGTAILNKDDELVMSMAAHTSANIFTYGLDETADLWADSIESMGLSGIRFALHHKNDRFVVHVPLLGQHSVHTALRATAVGLVQGMAWDDIIAGLGDTRAQLRLVAATGPNGSTIIDDTYNSSPDSALAALNLLNDLQTGATKPSRAIAVLGDMLELGYVEEAQHRLVGRRAAEVVQLLIVVGERGRWMGEEALVAGLPAAQVMFVDEGETAVSILQQQAKPTDTILIKGSWGMRLDRIVAAFADRT